MGREDDNYDWRQDEEDDPDARLEWAELECGLHPDGQCSLAGSEHCDFVCPFRDSEDFAGSAAWIAKHKQKDAP